MIAPLGSAVAAHHQPARHSGRLRGYFHGLLTRARRVRPCDDGRVLVRTAGVADYAERGERVRRVAPDEAAVLPLPNVEWTRDARRQLSHLHAVAEVTRRAHRVGDPIAGVVERELRHVTDRNRCASSEIHQFQHRSGRARAGARRGSSCTRACTRPCTCTRACAPRRTVQHGEPIGLVTRETEAAHALELALRSRRQLDDGQFRTDSGGSAGCRGRTTAATPASPAAPGGVRARILEKRHPLVVSGDGRVRGTSRAAASARGAGRGTTGRGIPDRKAQFPRAGRRSAHHDFGVAFVRREDVGKPPAVIRERRRANPLPGEQIVQRELPARGRRRRPLGDGRAARGAERQVGVGVRDRRRGRLLCPRRKRER